MREPQNFYTLLGVQRNASQADIRWAYERALNRASRDGAHRVMTDLSRAYDTLSNARARQTYDRHGLPALRERSPGAAPLPPPWRSVKQSPLPAANNAVLASRRVPRSGRRWRVPILTVFSLGVVAGLLLALHLVGTAPAASELGQGSQIQQVHCEATAVGLAYDYAAAAGEPLSCGNGAVPRVMESS